MKVSFTIDGVDYLVQRIGEADMRAIMNDHERSHITGYPTYWAIIDNEFVVWPLNDKITLNVVLGE